MLKSIEEIYKQRYSSFLQIYLLLLKMWTTASKHQIFCVVASLHEAQKQQKIFNFLKADYCYHIILASYTTKLFASSCKIMVGRQICGQIKCIQELSTLNFLILQDIEVELNLLCIHIPNGFQGAFKKHNNTVIVFTLCKNKSIRKSSAIVQFLLRI